FGTDGWRARIAEEFTFDNVRLVTQAFVEHLKASGIAEKGVAVGYDNRFQSEDFARTAAEVCSGAGIETLLTAHSVPSPVLSFAVKNRGLAAGIMITASHNPPDWNGFKIKEGFGGSAFPETTKAVEKQLDKLQTSNFKPQNNSKSQITKFDPDPEYLAKIKSLVDLDSLKTHNLKIVIDPMYGSGSGYFKKLGLAVIEIRGRRDPLFGGVNPEPLPVNLEESISFVKETALKYKNELTACIILDGDADRLAAIDASGRFINTHNIFSLLLRHLKVNRRLSGDVIKTFNLTNLIDKQCKKYDQKLEVVPIGFKNIARKMMEKDILLGGEESGGMGLKGFIPERDGILAGLTLLEMVAYEKKNLAQMLEEIMNELGHFYYDRLDLHTNEAQTVVKKLTDSPPATFAGRKIAKVETLDGLKFNFEDESWILFRASGTEPLLRVYVEGRTPEEVKLLLGAGEDVVRQNS
ncbi:MAG: phosphoglucomutase/phosphomannomutase family protein, partial [Candidatus Margulisbacteria bacterium]|nr:phosphoglucomutase/phosphomannomutase family protein [Candidatus Margulisiibacteriota bacterium]